MSWQWLAEVGLWKCATLLKARSVIMLGQSITHFTAVQVYQLFSLRISASKPDWADTSRIGPVSASYAGVFFTEARVRGKLSVRFVQGLVWWN